MDSSLRNTSSLIANIDKLSMQLVQRYLNMVTLSQTTEPSSNDDNSSDGEESSAAKKGSQPSQRIDRNQAAVNSLKMDVETAAFVKAAEDILTISRQMKEMWLFGPLKTLDEDSKGDIQAETEDHAEEVGKLLEKALG